MTSAGPCPPLVGGKLYDRHTDRVYEVLEVGGSFVRLDRPDRGERWRRLAPDKLDLDWIEAQPTRFVFLEPGPDDLDPFAEPGAFPGLEDAAQEA